PRKESASKRPALRRITAKFARTPGSANGARATKAISQRQKFSAAGSKTSRSARPRTQLPAQNSVASARSRKAVRREGGAVVFICGLESRSSGRAIIPGERTGEPNEDTPRARCLALARRPPARILRRCLQARARGGFHRLHARARRRAG